MNLSMLAADSVQALVARLQETISRINTVWGKEHQADGTHAIPKYRSSNVASEVGASNFRGADNMTLTSVTVTTWDWWKHGDAMFLSFDVSGTVGGTPSTSLVFDIPGGFTAKAQMRNVVELTDAGAQTTGVAFVNANGRTVSIFRTDRANFTAGAVGAFGQIQFRTTA